MNETRPLPTDALAPCPFCGSHALLDAHADDCYFTLHSRLKKSGGDESLVLAVHTAWNRRTPAPVGVETITPFISAQRERLFYNRPENIGKGLAMADWHRVVQYVEAAHGIGIKGGQHGTDN